MIEVAVPTSKGNTIGDKLELLAPLNAALRSANSRIRATRDWADAQ